MQNKGFNDIITYIEQLATSHNKIQHGRDERTHFIRLDTDELDTGLISRAGFPLVCLDRYSAHLSGTSGNPTKVRGITLMFLDQVGMAKDYDRIHQVWNECEQIADDFIARIWQDAMKGIIPGVKAMDLSGIEYELATAQKLNLYGVIVTFTFESGICLKPSPGAFT